MKIRLGYACVSCSLNETCSHTVSYTNYLKEENKLEKLSRVLLKNLVSLEHIIDYNIKNNIHFFRISSNIVPLATKMEVKQDYITDFKNIYLRLGEKIRESEMRVDFHPDQFCVLNSAKDEVLKSSVRILKYQYNLCKALGLKDKVLVIHIGSSELGKEESLKRFENNFNKLPKHIRECIVIENDDKVFNVEDTLKLCERIERPMVLDYHHHICNGVDNGIEIKKYYTRIFETWNGKTPKVHFSSSKSKLKKEIRHHSDYIDSDSFISFVNGMKDLTYDIDIMIEAKAKDDALFRLVRELKYKTNYKFIDETTFEV